MTSKPPRFKLIWFMRRAIGEFSKNFSGLKLKGSFVQNVSIVLSGNLFVLGVQLILTPIISRIFDPSSYGEFAFYNIAITNIGFIASLSYPSIYLIPESRKEFLALGKTVLFLVFMLSVLSGVVYLSVSAISSTFKIEPFIILLIIVLILLNALNGIFQSDCVRNKKFGRLSLVKSLSALVSKLSVILYGLNVTTNGLGLVLGDFIRSSFLLLFLTSRKKKKKILSFFLKKNSKEIINTAKKYSRAPKYIFPFQLLNKLSTDFPQLAIGLLYSQNILGSFIFALSLLSIPIQLFENSIQPVIYQKAIEKYREGHEELRLFFLKSIGSAFLIGLLPILILSICSPFIFPFFFGEEWKLAGEISLIIGLKNVFWCIQVPYLKFWNVLSKEKKLLKIDAIGFILRNSPLLLALMDVEFNWFLFSYAILNAVAFSLNFLFLSFELLKKEQAFRLNLILIVLIILCSFLIFFISNYLEIL